jgi:hypothetical protein
MLALIPGCFVGLKGWEGWLDLRRQQLLAGSGRAVSGSSGELADLRKRVRTLERIALGID